MCQKIIQPYGAADGITLKVLLAVELNLHILWDISSVTPWSLEQHLLLAEWLCVMEMVQTGVSHISEKLTQLLWGSVTLQTFEGKSSHPSKMLALKHKVLLKRPYVGWQSK